MTARSDVSAESMTRATSPALDALLGEAIPVLDHGFIRVIAPSRPALRLICTLLSLCLIMALSV